MSPSDPSFRPPEETPRTKPADAGDLPPLVLPVDPATLARHHDDLPPLVLPVYPRFGDDLPPLVLPAPRPPHPGFWWSFLWCLGYLFFAQLIPAIVVMIVAILVEIAFSPNAERVLKQLQQPATAAEFENRLLIPTVAATELAGILVGWLAVRLVVGRDWKRRLALRRPAAAHVLLVFAGLPGLLVVGEIIYTLASEVLPGFRDWGLKDITAFQEQTRSWPWWVVVLVVGLGPGVGEELWCRGFLGRGLVGRYGAVAGIPLTAFFFGLLHVDPPHAVAAFTMGLVLHFVYLTTRSLWLPMLMHFLNNSASVLEDSPLGNVFDDAMKRSPWLLAVAAVLLLGAVAWALYRSRARLVPTAESGGVPWQPAFPGVEYPPAGSHTTVVHPWPDAWAWGPVLVAFAIFGLAVTYFGIGPPKI